MSSKYQEALDELCSRCYVDSDKCTCHPRYEGGKCGSNCEYRQLIQELVDKEKPMKAIIYNTNQFICPRCKKQIKGQKMIYNDVTKKFDIKSKIKCEKIYCPYCDGKLDWSEEEYLHICTIYDEGADCPLQTGTGYCKYKELDKYGNEEIEVEDNVD